MTQKNPLTDYYEALERLKKRKAKINNDTVAVEAGRKRGTIKKSRDMYKQLIVDIENAAKTVACSDTAKLKLLAEKQRSEKYRDNVDSLRAQLDAALSRELSLIAELYSVKKTLKKLTGANVLPLRPSS
jgi:hypothetical protein